MLIISSQFAQKTIPIQIQLDAKEEQICTFIKAACQDLSAILGQTPSVRIVGGWVRDKLLHKPSKDMDLTVDMKGDEFAQWLFKIAQQRFGTNQKIVSENKTTEGRPEQIKNLSVAFLKIYGQAVEILPLRGNEVYEAGSRNPVSTSQSDAAGDSTRRDLTINSLFYNITTGQIEDFTGKGYDDLLTMTLRTPCRPGHDPNNEALRIFTEDPLRLLRVLRFHSRYKNSQIDPEVLTAMQNEDVQHQIVRRLYGDESMGIVPERTSEELKKIMIGEQPEKAMQLMYKTGLLQKLLMLPQEFQPLHMDQKNKHHSMTVIDHTMKVLGNVNNLAKEFKLDDKQRMTLNFSALFHDIGKLDPRSHANKPDGTRGYYGDRNNPNAITHQQSSQEHWSRFANALKFSTDETNTIGDMVLNHMNPHDHVETNEKPSDKQLRKYIRTNPSWVFQYIHAMADASSKDDSEDLSHAQQPYRENLERLKTLAPNADSFGNMALTQDILSGQEIIAIVGLNPRPVPGMTGYINIVKELLRDQQDANPTFSKQEATNLLQQITNQGKSGSGLLAPYFSPQV